MSGSFTANNNTVFFWDLNSCWRLDFSDLHIENKKLNTDFKFKKLGLNIEKSERKQTYIMELTAGSNPKLISIKIYQGIDEDLVIIWDTQADREYESFDLGKKSKTFYDSDGNHYITEDQKVIVTEQGVTLKSFDVETVFNYKNLAFSSSKGHKMDTKNHNWIIFSDYIGLSFSFMTLVIRDKHQESA